MRTFIDSGVLIIGWRGQVAERIRALTVLSQPQQRFIASPYVQLEVLLKPRYFKQQAEEEFYQTYFASVSVWIKDCEAITREAQVLGARYGLGALDALHVAAACLGQAEEFVTTERLTSPLHRVKEIKIVSLG